MCYIGSIITIVEHTGVYQPSYRFCYSWKVLLKIYTDRSSTVGGPESEEETREDETDSSTNELLLNYTIVA